MTDPISNNPSPLERKKYEKEYKQGVDLFQRALREYQKAESPFQKAEFKSVMDKALNVLNETANELARKTLQEQNEKIGKDYAAFQQSPESEATIEKLGQDLSKAKRSV